MYLKSLVLKGFKSFADRSVLTLEPGITAIVGPNGSGKSNISDAVLWVLGERSARNLRGQAMEDIIFAGSAARKAVSVAEVDLVLDNTDGTLPVDFEEVVITRRMYRSGESEYLVNGVVARRLDVLDILHDTGLGTGTHSIISQGSLDSVLQSKPEDRRALIEEAAGVLKHKQRKEKSARKLEAMDNHLHRVRDVTAEVARQLGPLERKAKRAQAYKEVAGKLNELRLSVAVDDLHELQEKWDAICELERRLDEELEQKKLSVDDAEQKVSDYQELMKRESEDAGELARRQRRAANLSEKLDSAVMLMRERRRASLGYEADMRASLDNSALRRSDALKELEAARQQYDEAQRAAKTAESNAADLKAKRDAIDAQFKSIDSSVAEVVASIRICETELDEVKRELTKLQEGLSNGLAHMKLVEARKVELSAELDRATEEHESAADLAEKAQSELAELESANAEAQQKLLEAFEARDSARAELDAIREQKHLIESEVKALSRSLEVSLEDDPALMWILENTEKFGQLAPVSRSIKVKGRHEQLVEALLGEDLAALSVKDSKLADSIAAALFDGDLPGDVTLVMKESLHSSKLKAARSCAFGTALIDELDVSQDMQAVVESLLGDVVICDSRQEAFQAYEQDEEGLRFVSSDGCALWPSGKVRLFGKPEDADTGVLARERRLAGLKERLDGCEKSMDKAEKASREADEAYRDAQSDSLKLSEKLANQKGMYAAARSDEERAAQRLSSVAKELGDIDAQVESATRAVDELRPDVDAAQLSIEQLEAQRTELIHERDDKAQAATPLREQLEGINEQLSEAKLTCATLVERQTYAQRIVDARRHDIDVINENARDARRSLYIKGQAIARGGEALEVLDRLVSALQRESRLLDEALDASQSSTSTMHADAANARDAARQAHSAFDLASSRMTQVQVDKSRLEVQVETAVNAVVRDCNTPLEVAEQLPRLDNRAEVEDEIFKLERRIKNMGVINPDAADEYAELKQRYDFLAGQLSDMEAARRSLNKIVRVIDSRMKDDFTRTFNEVNENFNEIFSLLFPGGSGHLSLENPDDIEHSGVEVTAQPRGKRLTKMMLMSGGEKSLTALALLFAVYKTRTTPFYILDEVEAALDDTNLRRLISYIDSLRFTTQLIMITHQRRTMEMADVLFGVSMQADGVTKVISQKLEHVIGQAN